ncbi:MAG: hypothetical protein WDO19_04085 [Bacteroidota bacterium]
MEENQTTSLFGLGIDPAAKAHLTEAARWARFLAIVGFVMIGLIVLIGIFAGSFLGAMTGGLSRSELGGSGAAGGVVGSFIIFVYIIIALIYFFPCLFLFRFANKMKAALVSSDQETLNTSFQNLKKLFRFVEYLQLYVLPFLR